MWEWKVTGGGLFNVNDGVEGHVGTVTQERYAIEMCYHHNAQLDAAPKQAPVPVDAEKEKRRHDDAAAFMAAHINGLGLIFGSVIDQRLVAQGAVENADALHAALAKGGKQ